MHFPNRIQAALLFDERFEALEAAGRDFCRIAQLKSGLAFSALEGGSEEFIRYLGAPGDLAATFELVSGPPSLAPFEGALASPVTGLFAPSIRDAILRARSHVLLEVSHAAPGPDQPSAELASIAPAPARAPLAQFVQRLETLALMTRITTDHLAPSAIHWTQSDQLLTPERFEAYATAGLPGPLHIHPHIFGSAADPQSEPIVGVRSFGAAHWLGCEVVARPSTLAWQAAYEAVLAFVHLALDESAAPIAHGDTFGSLDGGESFRVLHRQADPQADEDAAFVIVPLRHDPSGFISDEYAASARITRERGTPASESATGSEVFCAPAQAIAKARRMIEEIDGALAPAEPARGAAPELDPAARHGMAEPAPPEPEVPDPALPDPSSNARSPAPVTPRPPRAMIRPIQSRPGDQSVSGRSLRARVFGGSEHETAQGEAASERSADDRAG